MPIDSALQPFIISLMFVLGLCVGSFLNVMGLRLLAEEEFVNNPSHCPACQHKLSWLENIPVVSYILQGAQCRSCKAGISIQYPIVELATGLLFAMVVWWFGVSLQSLLLLFLVSNLVVITITDWHESLIFQINSLSLVPVGLVYSLLNLGNIPGAHLLDLGVLQLPIYYSFIDAVIGIIVAIVFFEGMILISQLLFGTEGFGHGDTHLMMGVGAFIGWKLTLLAIGLGFVVQLIPALPVLVLQWVREKRWVSLISGAIAVLGALVPFVLMLTPGLVGGLRTSTFIQLGCLVLSLIALVVFMRNIKASQSYTYLPLGPSLVIGSLIGLFWGEPLLKTIIGFYS